MLKEIHTNHEILVDVMDMFDGTGFQVKATKTVKALEDIHEKPTIIVASGFDTTATNSGLNTGVVVKVQEALKQPAFQLACRHHIFELLCEVICKNVLEKKQNHQINQCLNS